MKELKNLVMDKDDKICKICTQMEQALLRISVNPAKPLSEVYMLYYLHLCAHCTF